MGTCLQHDIDHSDFPSYNLLPTYNLFADSEFMYLILHFLAIVAPSATAVLALDKVDFLKPQNGRRRIHITILSLIFNYSLLVLIFKENE